MATRLYGRENGTAPGTPSVDGGWESSASPFARSPMFTTTDGGDTLTTVAGFGSTAGQDRCHRQWISRPMNSGFTFDNTVTYKAYMQCLESAANDNIRSRLCVRILSEDLSTVRHTCLAIADYSTGAEWNTALRNKAFANGDAGSGSYTTVAGDRLVVEWGHNDSAGASISGSSRWGSAGSADLGENETSTATNERPWFECSLNLTFFDAISGAGNIASGEAFGSDNVDLVAAPSGISSGEQFGAPAVDEIVAATGIASGEQFGGPLLVLAVDPSGIASLEAFGADVLQLVAAAAGIGSGEALGTPTVEVSSGQNIDATGIPSGEAFGTATTEQAVAPAGIPSGEAFGTALAQLGLAVVGISSGEQFGAPGMTVVLVAAGIPSGEQFGAAVVAPVLLVEPTGIPSPEGFGTPRLDQAITAVAISSSEAFGAMFLDDGSYQPGIVWLRPRRGRQGDDEEDE